MAGRTIKINRAQVLTLWGAVVAARIGFTWDEALTLGRAIAGLAAKAKARSLGMIEPSPKSLAEERKRAEGRVHIAFMGREVPMIFTADGLRADEKGQPCKPASVQRYLESKFSDALPDTIEAMKQLAASMPIEDLRKRAFRLYEAFRPEVPLHTAGWGAAGELKLDAILTAAKSDKAR